MNIYSRSNNRKTTRGRKLQAIEVPLIVFNKETKKMEKNPNKFAGKTKFIKH